jgi:hypothetical protein
MSEAFWRTRFGAHPTVSAAPMLGVFGLLADSDQQRVRDIGVRRALSVPPQMTCSASSSGAPLA